MEEKSNEELVERIEFLTKQLEEDVQEGGAGRREREKLVIQQTIQGYQQAIEEHQKRFSDLCKKDAEAENGRKEFSSIEAELGKRRRIEEEELEREKQEQAELRRRRKIRQEELEREKQKEQERKRRISGEFMEEGGSLQQQEQQQEVNRGLVDTGFDNLVRSFLLSEYLRMILVLLHAGH